MLSSMLKKKLTRHKHGMRGLVLFRVEDHSDVLRLSLLHARVDGVGDEFLGVQLEGVK